MITNFEKHKDKLIGIEDGHFGVDDKTGTVICCGECDCTNCRFSFVPMTWCVAARLKWLFEEYKEPEIDWSNVLIDTPILVSYDDINWSKRHFAGVNERGKVLAWVDGTTSFTVKESHPSELCVKWDYAKLAD